jgi:hypothetical protein
VLQLQRFPGVATAVFPNGPEHAVYNNALLERDLAAAERANSAQHLRAGAKASRARPLTRVTIRGA